MAVMNGDDLDNDLPGTADPDTISGFAVDGENLTLSFSGPQIGIGLTGGITDLLFDFIQGEQLVNVPGQGGFALQNPAGSTAFLGLVSDVPFTQVDLSVSSFDTNASSVGFASLQGQIDLLAAPQAVPAPSLFALFASAFGVVALLSCRARQGG